jgi:hypothetical protein
VGRRFESCRGRHNFNDLDDIGGSNRKLCPYGVRKVAAIMLDWTLRVMRLAARYGES